MKKNNGVDKRPRVFKCLPRRHQNTSLESCSTDTGVEARPANARLRYFGNVHGEHVFTLSLPSELAGTTRTIQEVYAAIGNHFTLARLNVRAPGAEGLQEHVARALCGPESLVRPCPPNSVERVDGCATIRIPRSDTPTVLMSQKLSRRTGNRWVPLTYEVVMDALASVPLHSVPAVTVCGPHEGQAIRAGAPFLTGEGDLTEYKEGNDVSKVTRYILPFVANMMRHSSRTGCMEAHMCLGVDDVEGDAVGCYNTDSAVGADLLRAAVKVSPPTPLWAPCCARPLTLVVAAGVEGRVSICSCSCDGHPAPSVVEGTPKGQSARSGTGISRSEGTAHQGTAPPPALWAASTSGPSARCVP